MNLSLDNEIRDKLASYLLGEVSLDDFEDWFVSASWNVNQSKNQAAINMVYETELYLSEFSDAFRSEDELKNLLRSIVENVNMAPISLQKGSNSQVERWLISVPSNILSSGASL